jgi:hypothetical protein
MSEREGLEYEDRVYTGAFQEGFAAGRPQWQTIETAPVEELVLVYGPGGVRIGVLDRLGNWRARHHGPHKGVPTHWMPLPDPPEKRG